MDDEENNESVVLMQDKLVRELIKNITLEVES